MISFVLLIIFAWSFYIGYSRGLVLQIFYSFASLLSLMIAAGNYKGLANILYLWVPFANATEGSSTYYFDSKYLFELDRIFYAGQAFLIIYMAVYAIMRILGILMHLLRFISPDTTKMNIISGALAVVVAWISLQIVLTIVATIPLATVQNLLHNSFLANAMIKETPILSNWLQQIWVTNNIG